MFNLWTNLIKCFSRFLKVYFLNNVDVKVCAKFLLDDFSDNYIILVFYPNLRSGSRFGTWFIYNISDLFFFKHSLHKIGQVETIFKIFKFFLFVFAIIIQINGYSKWGAKKNEKVILSVNAHTGSHNLKKWLLFFSWKHVSLWE